MTETIDAAPDQQKTDEPIFELVDRLLRKGSPNLRDELSLMFLVLRFQNEQKTLDELASLLKAHRSAMDAAVNVLLEIGFLKHREVSVQPVTSELN